MLHSETIDIGDMRTPMVEVAFGDRNLADPRCPHHSPKFGPAIDTWLSELDAIDEFTQTPGLGPTVLAGDYNATRWHPAMRRSWTGPSSMHTRRSGRGSVVVAGGRSSDGRSAFPSLLQSFAPFARLDHALVHDVGVVRVTDGDAAGSDHLPFEVTVVPEQ